MIKSVITDGGGNGKKARVTSLGQLVTAPLSYDQTSYKLLDVDNTAYNFYLPKPGQQFVITSIIFRANKLVSAVADATVVVYEATSASTATVSKTLFEMQTVEGDIFSLIGMNILVNEGVFINAKTTDDDIAMNITGYYIPKIS